jgi:hypothetical protein
MPSLTELGTSFASQTSRTSDLHHYLEMQFGRPGRGQPDPLRPRAGSLDYVLLGSHGWTRQSEIADAVAPM